MRNYLFHYPTVREWLRSQLNWHLLPKFKILLAPLFRKRVSIKIRGLKNYNNLKFSRFPSHVKITGDHNKLCVAKSAFVGTINVEINGRGNSLTIADDVCLDNINVLFNGDHSDIIIGKRSYISQATLLCVESNTTIHIGRDCMLAHGIEIRTGDSHGIFDRRSRVRLNVGKKVDVGDHVWIANGVLILKGGSIPNGCIIGAQSIVTKALNIQNAVYAGSPVRLIREDIVWSWHLNRFPDEVIMDVEN